MTSMNHEYKCRCSHKFSEALGARGCPNCLGKSGAARLREVPTTMEAAIAAAVTAERQKHQTDIERWKDEAATAEKWRGLALSKDGDGRTVQRIQQEAAAAEREACALVSEKNSHRSDDMGAIIGRAIRARGQA